MEKEKDNGRQILKYALLRARARSANNATWKLWGLARQPPATRMMYSIEWLASHPRDDENGGCFCGCAARAQQRTSRVDEEVCRVARGPPGEAQRRGNDLLVRARCGRQRATELLSAGGGSPPRAAKKNGILVLCGPALPRRPNDVVCDGVPPAGGRAPAGENRQQTVAPAPLAGGRTRTSATFGCAPRESAEQDDEGSGVAHWARCAERRGRVVTTVLRTVPRGGRNEKNTKLFQVWHAPRSRAMTRWCRLLPRHHMPP